jgi:hypothetical protein
VPTRQRRLKSIARRTTKPQYVLDFLRELHEQPHIQVSDQHPDFPMLHRQNTSEYTSWLSYAIAMSKRPRIRPPRSVVARAVAILEDALSEKVPPPPIPEPTHPAITWLRSSKCLADLRRCRHCGLFFFPRTATMGFCSKQCNNASRDHAGYMRRWRQIPSNKLRVKPKVPRRGR